LTIDRVPAAASAGFSADADASALILRPEPSRVVLRPFIPAENGDGPSHERPRVARILERILAMSEPDLHAELSRVLAKLRRRHRDVERVLTHRFHELIDPRENGMAVNEQQMLLAGAFFTEEYSFEAAALFNPSVVPHPNQDGAQAGSLRLVFSLRAVGEGHISSITFRTGVITAEGSLTIDPPNQWAISPQIERTPGGLPDDPGLRIFYGEHQDLSQLVIFPITLPQRHGIEDLRLVRFVEDDGHAVFLGTYTAFSGEAVRQELLRTSDFVTFELNALRGELSATKGMALFPRRIGGHYAMLGRHDHENIWFLKSNDLYQWNRGAVMFSPRWPWEFVQVGVCSPPIEIDEGWLVITHGVGAIRSYCLGCCLLDKSDPSKVLARSTEPLLEPGTQAQEGYVPNVAYSCGAIVHNRNLLLPYGVADTFSAFETLSLDAVLKTMN
jgi:predicted GH43/DUF377 family glycosyl hydrolase